MPSGDPLVSFLPILFSFPTSPHTCFLFFFHQILNCLLYLLERFFLFLFSSALVQYFFIPRVIVLIIHYLFSYICQLSAIKNHNIPCIKEMNSISYL